MQADAQESIKKAKTTVGKLVVQIGILLFAALIFGGLAFLVYSERIQPDVLFFASGVMCGVLLKAFIDTI